MAKKLLPSKTEHPADWYSKVIQIADLADYGPAKGTMILKPYGYAIWEQIQKSMDAMIKEHGVGNAYFPLFIPMSLLDKEKSHVDGFSPELAVVTHGGGEELEEPLAIRPTSETIMYEAFSRWIQSWRDLPVMMNQWNNVVRWEKRTYLFMRTSEFLWQEGHTAHATHEGAIQTQRWAMDMYEKVYRDYFAMFGYTGYKSLAERFAGADSSMTFEALMPSGKALQCSTSHDLGQNFSKVFDITFQNKEGQNEHVWQTSWGLSTRSIGGLILAHGDDNGLRLPPKLAPAQVVILPVRVEDNIVQYARKVAEQLMQDGIRVEVDDRSDETIGYRINKWEVKGAPIRIEIGDREVDANSATIVKRDDDERKRHAISTHELVQKIQQALNEIQEQMYKESKKFTEQNTREAKNYDEFKKIMKEHKGFIKVHWNDNSDVETRIQKDTTATSRCRPFDQPDKPGQDFISGEPADQVWYFGQAY